MSRGFHIPIIMLRNDGDELFLLIFLSHIKDSLDAIHVSQVLDPKYDRSSIKHLVATQARKSTHRLQQRAAFEAELYTYERDMDNYMTATLVCRYKDRSLKKSQRLQQKTNGY